MATRQHGRATRHITDGRQSGSCRKKPSASSILACAGLEIQVQIKTSKSPENFDTLDLNQILLPVTSRSRFEYITWLVVKKQKLPRKTP